MGPLKVDDDLDSVVWGEGEEWADCGGPPAMQAIRAVDRTIGFHVGTLRRIRIFSFSYYCGNRNSAAYSQTLMAAKKFNVLALNILQLQASHGNRLPSIVLSMALRIGLC